MKILVCNDSFAKALEKLKELLPEHGICSCPPNHLPENLDDIDVIIPSISRISAEVIARGNFGFVQQMGIGLDSVDVEAATKAGVLVAHVPGAGSGNAESVAELAILFILGLLRRYRQAHENASQGIFFRPSGRSLLDKTVCIIGLGDIGTAIAERLIPFGVKLKGVRRNPRGQAPAYWERVYAINDLGDALADSDVVVLALPETAESKNLINRDTIAMMKPGVYLINIARGGIIDYDALIDALRSGQVAGVGLDVFWHEPADPADPIFQYNVMATPHIGGNTDSAFIGITNVIVENIRRYAQGLEPLHTVNTIEAPRRTKVVL